MHRSSMTRCSGTSKMDELKFNKLFAGVLLGLLLMAGIKAGDILVPSHDGPPWW